MFNCNTLPFINIASLATYFNLTLNKHRTEYEGICPLCSYAKITCHLKNIPNRIVVCCNVCQQNKELFNLFRNTQNNNDNSDKKLSGRVYTHKPTRTKENNNSISKQIKKRQYAYQLYTNSQELQGTVGETYFRNRGLCLSNKQNTNLPKVLRFSPQLKYESNLYYPAIVSPITDAKGRFMAVHRTFLTYNGQSKAPVRTPKKTLGEFSGGSIKLKAVGEILLLTEGVETAIAAMIYFNQPAWACVCTGGLERVKLPPPPLARNILIVADNDANNAGMKAARKTEERLLFEGRNVSIIKPIKTNTDIADLFSKGESLCQ